MPDTADPTDGELQLVDRMRAASKKAHNVSDALVNSKLVVAFTDPELYGQALSSFWPVFRTIEEKLDKQQANKDFRDLLPVLHAIRRTKRLEKDLDYFLGENWQSRTLAPAAVARYLEHLDALEREDPALLLVFSYHMHMAVCAGGAMIKKMARKAMELPKDKGTAVFEFELEKGVFLNHLISDYKAGMNKLGVSKGTSFSARAEAESLMLFKLNNNIVASFHAGPLGYIRIFSMMCPKSVKIALMAAAATFLLVFAARNVLLGSSRSPTGMLTLLGLTMLLVATLSFARMASLKRPSKELHTD